MLKVSVITPVLNSINYVEVCIQNVLNQTYPNIEHIIVDGGSKDGSLDVINKYCIKYPKRIKLVNGNNNGCGEAINMGLDVAEGEICSWYDSDDVYETNAVEIAVSHFDEKPDILFLYGGCNQINLKGEIQFRFPIMPFDLRKWIEIWISGKQKPLTLCCAAFFKKELIKKTGKLNAIGGDLDFLVRICKHTKLLMIPELLGSWRYNPEGISLNKNERTEKLRMRKVNEDLLIAEKYEIISRYERYIIGFIYSHRKYLSWLYPFMKPIGSCIIKCVIWLRIRKK